MKNFLKQFRMVRDLSAAYKRAWWSYTSNPDLLYRVERWLYEKSQPKITFAEPTKEEEILIQALRARVSALPPLVPNESTAAPERMWMNYKNQLRQHLLTEDPRNFLAWGEVIGTMNAGLNRHNYNRLKKLAVWPELNKKLSVPVAKNQPPHYKYQKVDPAVMQQVFHLAEFKAAIGTDMEDIDLIVEFGGGFGAMCIAAKGLGFKGEYILYDWPEFLLLQEFYFKWHDIDTSRITFVDNFADLKTAVAGRRGLLIGMWSISETGVALRRELFETVHASQYLIGYQQQVVDVNNHVFFKEFADSRPDIAWKDFPCLNFPGQGNRWLMGKTLH